MVHFFESYFKMGSIFWVMFETSGFNFYESMLKKKGSISMSHVEEMGSILWVTLKRRVQFCESYKKNKFNSLRLIQKKSSILWVVFRKGFNFFDPFFRKEVNSLSHIEKKGSFLWVILKRMVQFFELYFKEGFNAWSLFFFEKVNYLNHIQKKINSLSRIQQKKKIQFLWVINKKSSVLRVIYKKVHFWIVFERKS